MDKKLIDLRSDTVTKPSIEMRKAMAEAEVGDDVFGEDPTVHQLEMEVAKLLGKPAAIFTPSGVMANQIAIKAHTQQGDEIIVERDSHIFQYETAAPSIISQVQLNTLSGIDGILTAEQVESTLRPGAYYFPRTSLICLENTHNRAGGTIYPLDEVQRISYVAGDNNLKMHLDGARLWNASVASGIRPSEYAKYFDSISVCFSKGLGAPIGSALVGSENIIHSARKIRKILGGGMRQSGIVAAGALYALRNNLERLKEDHQKAYHLAKELSNLSSIYIKLSAVQTNIVMIDISKTGKKAQNIVMDLRNLGVLVLAEGEYKVRVVTHLDVTSEQIGHTIRIMKKYFK